MAKNNIRSVRFSDEMIEIINQQVLARVTMTQDPIDQICSQAQAQIEALLK